MRQRALGRLRARRFPRAALLVAVTLATHPLVTSGPVGAATTTITAGADATVSEDEPTENFGSAPSLGVDERPRAETYLLFEVPPFSGQVTRATLRLFAEDKTRDGPEVRSAAPTWNEGTITWENRPDPLGGAVADTGKISRGEWVTYDVTTLVAAPGLVGFHLEPESSDGADFTSREGSSNRPELVVETAATPDPSGTAQFGVAEDAYANERDPVENFGGENRLKVQGGSDPDIVSYLRFDVSGLTGTVSRATLRTLVFNDTVDGPAVLPTTGAWSEGGLTWENRPGPTGPAVVDLDEVADGWVEFDVTPLVSGNGPVNVMLVSDHADSFTARSSEAGAGEGPELLVETVPVISSTTTTTTLPSTTTTSSTTTSTTMPPTTTTTVPPTTTTTRPMLPPVPEAGEPWLGLARVTTAPCQPDCARHLYSLSVENISPADAGDQRSDFRFPPGGSAVLRLEWSRTSSTGGTCPAPTPVSMAVSLRRPGGSRIGSTTWTVPVPTTCSGSVQRTVHFDNNPLDGAADDPDYHGVMEVYGRLSGGDEAGADTRGAAPARPGIEAGRYARGHFVSGGVMVGWHEDGDDPVALAASEATLGEPFGLVRSYASNWGMPSTRVRDWLAQHKYVLWSTKPPRDASGNYDWTPVAAGLVDDMIRRQVDRLQAWAAAGNVQVGYIFHHEPHDDADFPGTLDDCEVPGDGDYPCTGTPDEFIDAYQRIRTIIDETGSDRVHLVYTAVLSIAGRTAPGSDVLGSGDEMTDGAGGRSVIDFVDYIAHDSYNWYCFRSRRDWEYPDEFGAWGRGVALAAAQDRPIILAETSSHPGCETALPHPVFHCEDADAADLPSPTRDDWFRRIGTFLESDADARRWIRGFAYFHSLHSNDWRFASPTGLTSVGQEGWRDTFTRDSSSNDGLGGHDYFVQYGFDNL